MNTICIFGDSIVYGESDVLSGGWATLLKRYIEENTAEDWINIYNLGISGDTTTGLLKRFKMEAEVRAPDLIMFGIGINDSVYRGLLDNNETPREEFNDNLKILIKKARVFTNNIIFVGLTKVEESKVQPLSDSATGKSYSNVLIQKYNSDIKSLCEKENLYFIEIFSLLENEDLHDGLHPNAQGHQKIFESVRDFLTANKILNLRIP